MHRIKIFCEGVTDQVFIADCLEAFFDIKIGRTYKKKDLIDMVFGNNCVIIPIGGCTNLTNELILDTMKDNLEEGGKNLIILDADYSGESTGRKVGTGNNGYKSAVQRLNSIKNTHNINFEYYLWHNNNDDGEIEDLLCQLIPLKRKAIFECVQSHQECLKRIEFPEIRETDLKMHLGYYLHTLSQKSDPGLRDYKNNSFWTLDCNLASDLLNFKKYLEAHLELD